MKILLKDIAQEANVSRATVTRVMNGNENVSTELTEKVNSAAKRLGFSFSSYEDKKINQTNVKVIGLIVSDLSNPFFIVLMRGVVSEARVLNYGVQIFETNEDFEKEKNILDSVNDYKFKGVIICASHISEPLIKNFAIKANIPIVLINRYISFSNISCIVIDYQKAMEQAATHLIELGHRRIAYLAGPSSNETSQKRRSGIEEAMRKAGLTLSSDLCIDSFPNEEGGFHAMISLLSLPEEKRPTGILAYNDMIAVGAYRAIRIRGLRIPEDISIIGNDNIEIASILYPPLTTVSPEKVHMGILAMQTINRMNSEDYKPSDGFIQLEAPLTLRYSTGPVPNN